jgi:SAM-dependent methyltransferase
VAPAPGRNEDPFNQLELSCEPVWQEDAFAAFFVSSSLDSTILNSPSTRDIFGKMSTVGDRYILPGQSDHDRLRVISKIHDGATRELLLQAGLTSGSRFVEFGCGMGYVSRWAATLGAHATGIDVNAEQVAACQSLASTEGLTNADFRTGNIYEPDFEPNSVDVAYCRWLMVHLNRPVEAMQAIRMILKPGGVMVCEEAGVAGVYTEPPSAAYEEMRDIALKAGRDRGVDYDGGRFAHTWAKDAGFKLVHVSAYHPHFLNGPYKGFWNWTMRNAALRLVEEGAMPQQHWQRLVDGMTAADNDPDTVVAHCRMHQLIARKP